MQLCNVSANSQLSTAPQCGDHTFMDAHCQRLHTTFSGHVECDAHHGHFCNCMLLLQELIESHVTLSIQAFVGLLHKNASWENVAGGAFTGSRLGPCAVQTEYSIALQFAV